jgi:hypothetical protein
MEEMAAVSVGEPELFNLKQPWLTPQAELDSPGLGEATFSKTWAAQVGERLTSPLTVSNDLRKRCSAQWWAATYSHGGVQRSGRADSYG